MEIGEPTAGGGESVMTLVRNYWRVALAAVLVAVGLLGWLMAHDMTSTASAQNTAMVDAAATSRVQSEVSRALTSVLSYDHANPAQTETAAREVLTGDASKEYETLLKTLAERAPGQQLVLTAVVQSAGVKKLSDTEASLLVFLDQSSQRAEDNEASYSAAQLAVKAKKVGKVWKISGLTPL